MCARGWLRSAALSLGLVAAAARANAPLFWDDFEASDFSNWTAVDRREGVTVERLPSAARWGTGGLRVVDNDGQIGAGDMTALYWTFDAGTSELVFRFWANITVTADAGEALIGQLYEQNHATVCGFLIRSPGRLLLAWNAAGTLSFSAPVPLPAGWHRYECRVAGLGADAGRLEAWLDEQLVAFAEGLDWGDVSPNFIAVGQPYSSDWRFTGVADFDHVSLDLRPTPVRMSLLAPDAGGPCRPAHLIALGAAGESVNASRALRVNLALDGGVALADDTCLVAVTSVDLPPGSMTAPLALQVERPQVDVTLSGEDLLDSTLQLHLAIGQPDAGQPDAGQPDATSDGGSPPSSPSLVEARYVVGCGCAASGHLAALCLLGLWLVPRRPPQRTASPQPGMKNVAPGEPGSCESASRPSPR
jgi:hypothetical protein